MADKAPDRGTVFISYSHKDEVWKDRLVQHLAPLRQRGSLEVWEDRRIPAGQDWKREIDRAIEHAKVALLLISPDWLASDWIQQIEAPQLLGLAERGELTLLPVILRPCHWQSVDWLSRIQAWPYHGKPLSSLRASAREQSLMELSRQILRLFEEASPEASAPAESRVSISRLPTPGTELFGRETELKVLDDAWENPRVLTLNIRGMGGIGKTALVGHWLSRMARDRFRGAEQVFAWSFYDNPSSEGFLEEALRSFGEVQAGSLSARERAAKLAERINQTRTLLILDGIEFVREAGKPEVFTLLGRLSSERRGLVILVSRFGLAAPAVLYLDGLRLDAGIDLLRSLGVQGTEQDLAAVSRELEGHPLALTLSSALLRQGIVTIEAFIAQIRQGVLQLSHGSEPDAAAISSTLQRMLSEYEKKLKPAGLALLWLHVLFNRSIGQEDLVVLLSPPIPGLTDGFELQSEQGRSAAFQQLAELGLLSLASSEAGSTSRLHPLVREHFRNRFIKEQPEAFRLGHERLFRHLASTVSGVPETLEAMQPLIDAVAHGCAADLRREALKLYRERIARGDSFYLSRTLGATATDLRILSSFFKVPWDQPQSDLDPQGDALRVLKAAGYALLAAGRLREARKPFTILLQRTREARDWADAIWAARRLSEAQLYLGDLGQALVTGREAVELAEKDSDQDRRAIALITLADALHQAGRLQEAEQTVEGISLASFRYFNLQLSLGRFQAMLKPISDLQSRAERSGQFPRAALAHLALGRAQIELGNIEHANTHVHRAVEILRRGVAQHWFPAALIERANLRLRLGIHLDEARQDLMEALEIATPSELRLHEADAHLALSRLYLMTSDPERARQSLSRARAIVDETGYHRRDTELQELEERLSSMVAVSPVDPVTLAFRLVLAGHVLPDLLLRPDLQKIEEAARRLSDEPGDPLLNAQRILEEQQPGIVPNPLWVSWITVTQGGALQPAGRRNPA